MSLAYAKQTGRGSHFDLLLQVRPGGPQDAILEAWEMAQNPFDHPGQQTVSRLQDHRGHYLDYEGQISGDRGSVRRVARGELVWLQRTAAARSLELDGICQKLEPVWGGGPPGTAAASATEWVRLNGRIQIAGQASPRWQIEFISTSESRAP